MKNGTGDYKIRCFQFVDGSDRNRKLRIIYKGSSRKTIQNKMNALMFQDGDTIVVHAGNGILMGRDHNGTIRMSSAFLVFDGFLRDVIPMMYNEWTNNGIANECLEQNSSTSRDIVYHFFRESLGDRKKANRVKRAMEVYHQRIKLNLFVLEEIRLWLDSLPRDQYNELVCRISFDKGI